MLLLVVYFFLIAGFVFLLFISNNNLKYFKIVSLLISGLILIFSTVIVVAFDSNSFDFQFLTSLTFLKSTKLGFDFVFGLDGLSIFFFFLTSLLTFLSILFIWEEHNFKFYAILLLFLEFLLLLTFSSLNLLLFYIFFECILIPIYLIIGLWGSREKKIRASYLLFFYTVFSSLPMLVSILYIYTIAGNLNIEYLIFFRFTFDQQLLLWITFFYLSLLKYQCFLFTYGYPKHT